MALLDSQSQEGMGPIATTMYKRMASLIAKSTIILIAPLFFLAKIQVEFLLIALCNNVHQRLKVLLSQSNKHVQ